MMITAAKLTLAVFHASVDVSADDDDWEDFAWLDRSLMQT